MVVNEYLLKEDVDGVLGSLAADLPEARQALNEAAAIMGQLPVHAVKESFWTEDEPDGAHARYACAECRRKQKKKTPYCPECGARMLETSNYIVKTVLSPLTLISRQLAGHRQGAFAMQPACPTGTAGGEA